MHEDHWGGRAGMATIKDVAREAGVSVGTASRVMTGSTSVAADLRERVYRAVRTLDYKPNLAARALKTNRVDVIGLILPDITNPFFAQLAREVEIAAAAEGLFVMLASSLGRPELEAYRMRAFLHRSLSGIIVVPAADQTPMPRAEGVPIVALDRAGAGLPLVALDHARSAALAADHLWTLGHRRIGYIAGPRGMAVSRERERGFAERLAALGPASVLRVEGEFDYASGERLARELLAGAPTLTAIAAASDQQAIGVIRAARDLGLRVPDDLSVVGFDDIALAALVVPRLTTIRQPARLLAQSAVRRILDPEPDPKPELHLGELVARDSTAPLSSGRGS
jgi:LacI family transcriptional regulator